MRVFAAVLPPEEALGELRRAVAGLRTLPGAELLRWTQPEGWHLTLAFYGEQDPAAVAELAGRLARAAGRRAPFEVRLSGGGRFGDRTLWAGIDGDRQAMTLLAGGASAAARKAGITHGPERRYHPHITLARTRDAHTALAPFAAALAPLTSGTWEVSRLALVRSDLPQSGTPGEQPRYTVCDSWPLGR